MGEPAVILPASCNPRSRLSLKGRELAGEGGGEGPEWDVPDVRDWSDPNGRDLAERLFPIRGVDAKGKQLPGCLMACPGVLYWYFRVAAKGEEIVPAVESIAVMAGAAARRRDEEVEAAAKGHFSWMAKEDASAAPQGAAWTGAGF